MYIIDRFEGEWIVVEDKRKRTFHLPISLVPGNAKEGDVINISVTIDPDATRKLRAEVTELSRGIFKD